MHPPSLDAALQRAADLLCAADAVLVAAGAGMGVDSGLPDFRGPQGFWRAYPALGRAGIDFYAAASPASFRRDPRLAWGFYGHRLALYRQVQAHAGFGLLAAWGRSLPAGWAVFTSNVDGHFQAAGAAGAALQECHGSIHWLQCLDDCQEALWSADALAPDVDTEQCRWRGALPRCPHCGALARPNILMFGDDAWNPARQREQAAQLQRWLGAVQDQRARLAVLELGAGTAVPSVRQFVAAVQRSHGARLVRVNPREAAVADPRDVGLPLGALAALQALAGRR